MKPPFRPYRRSAPRASGPRRSWHGAHRETVIYGAARFQAGGRRAPPSLTTILAVALMLALGALIGINLPEPRGAAADSAAAQSLFGTESAASTATIDFAICGSGPRVNCVVDGDTFWMGGQKIRILDIDTAELSPSRCAEEERLGQAAKHRLHELLNGGRVTLETSGRDRDRYGRLLRRTYVDGRSVGTVLIGEGLARPYGGGRRSWCG